MKTNPFHQTVIGTGGATGIGYALAAQFVERGANVLLNGRTRAKLAVAAEKLGNSDRVAFIAADITQPANAQTIVDAALERFGRLEVLVNNAGIFYNKPVHRLHGRRSGRLSWLPARHFRAHPIGRAGDAAAAGRLQRLSVWRRKVSARAGRSGNDFRVREVNVWRAMLAQLASGSKCF